MSTVDPQKLIRDKRLLYLPFYERVLNAMTDFISESKTHILLHETYRHPERQRWLYAQGRTRSGKIVTNKETESMHVAGLAVDVIGDKNPQKAGLQDPYNLDWPLFGQIAQNHGLRWGGQWGDMVHVEWKFADSAAKAEFWNLYRKYGVLAAWEIL